jgi:hypothetical protein
VIPAPTHSAPRSRTRSWPLSPWFPTSSIRSGTTRSPPQAHQGVHEQHPCNLCGSPKAHRRSAQYGAESTRYEETKKQARQDLRTQVDHENAQTRADQEQIQQHVRSQVDKRRQEWRQENRRIEQEYSSQAGAKRAEADAQIDAKITETDQTVDRHLSEAKTQVADEHRKAQQKAEEEKKKAQDKQGGGFLGWAKRAVSSVVDVVKGAVNAVFDALRSLVRTIIDGAKKAISAVIDAARAVVVAVIKTLGTLLRALVSVALAAFPQIAARARAWIDQQVNSAVNAVNNLAERLKRTVVAILDRVASAIDRALSALQHAFLAALDGLKALALKAIEFAGQLAKFLDLVNGPLIKGIRAIIANPGIISDAIRAAVAPMIAGVPGQAQAALKRAVGQSGAGGGTVQRLAVQRQPGGSSTGQQESVWRGIWRHLGPKLEYLKNNWWEVLKQTGRQLLMPWEGMGRELGELWEQIKKGWDAAKSFQWSKLVDAILAISRLATGILGRWYGWFAIASVLIGAVIGAFFGGAGAIPGALAGLEFAGAVGEGLVYAELAIQGASIAKAAYNLGVQDDAGKDREDDYEQIAGSGITIGVLLALMLLSPDPPANGQDKCLDRREKCPLNWDNGICEVSI